MSPRTPLALALLAASALLSACVPSSSSYQIHSAAAPPPPKPTSQNGLPMDTDRAAYLESDTVASAGAPYDASKTKNGIRVPKLNVSAGMRVKRSEHSDISIQADFGSPKWSTKTERDALGDTGDYYGLGAGYNLHTGTAQDAFRVSFHLGASILAVPYVQISQRLDDVYRQETRDWDLQLVPRLAITPSYRLESGVRFYTGIRFAPHVTTRGDRVVTIEDGDQLPTPVTTSGIDNDFIVGVDTPVTDTLRFGAYGHMPFGAHDVHYRPSLGVQLSVNWDSPS